MLVGLVAGSCVGCDQVTKAVAHQHLAGQEVFSMLGGTVRLSYVENPGAFLSLGADLPAAVRFWAFGVLVALALAAVTAHLVMGRTTSAAHLVGMAMILGGGLGNLIDRASTGVVRDFLNMGIGPLRTGIFNLADLAITTGFVIVLCSYRVRLNVSPSSSSRSAAREERHGR